MLSRGPTFSWAGDPSSLRDLVDAAARLGSRSRRDPKGFSSCQVRRGHSVDWADVHRKAGVGELATLNAISMTACGIRFAFH